MANSTSSSLKRQSSRRDSEKSIICFHFYCLLVTPSQNRTLDEEPKPSIVLLTCTAYTREQRSWLMKVDGISRTIFPSSRFVHILLTYTSPSVLQAQSGFSPQLQWEAGMEQVPAQPHQICLVKALQLLQPWQLE